MNLNDPSDPGTAHEPPDAPHQRRPIELVPRELAGSARSTSSADGSCQRLDLQPSPRSKPVVDALTDAFHWLEARDLIHEDVLIDDLASPELSIGGKRYVSFSSNNYLGLSTRPEVLEASKNALLEYTNGTSESRKLGGNLRLLEELEDVLSAYKGKEDTMLFATGLMANVGVIPAITDISAYMALFHARTDPKADTVIVGDRLNHRSIQMGIKLSRARAVKYEHLDMADLERQLEAHRASNLFVITDSVFSMDGDLAPLDQIAALADAYGAALMIDDAHASGIYGPNGRGAAEHFGVTDQVDFLMGTLSKSFGGIGGFVSARRELIRMLKVNTDTYYFTSSLTAASAAGLIAAVTIASREEDLRTRLWRNVLRTLKGLHDLGLKFPLRFSQIIPVMLYEASVAYELEAFLFERGILCSAVTVPAVAPGKARLRLSINASHTPQHVDQLLNALLDATVQLALPTAPGQQAEWQALLGHAPRYLRILLTAELGAAV